MPAYRIKWYDKFCAPIALGAKGLQSKVE